jgi:hypothetical protein
MWNKVKQVRFNALRAAERQGALTEAESAELLALTQELDALEAAYLHPVTERMRQEREALGEQNSELEEFSANSRTISLRYARLLPIWRRGHGCGVNVIWTSPDRIGWRTRPRHRNDCYRTCRLASTLQLLLWLLWCQRNGRRRVLDHRPLSAYLTWRCGGSSELGLLLLCLQYRKRRLLPT